MCCQLPNTAAAMVTIYACLVLSFAWITPLSYLQGIFYSIIALLMNIDNHEHEEFQPGEKLRETGTTDRRKSVQVRKAYLYSSGAHSAFFIFGSVSAICNAMRTVKVELDARLVEGLGPYYTGLRIGLFCIVL